MTIEKIIEETKKICDGTNFSLQKTKEGKNRYRRKYVCMDFCQDNPCGEGLHHEIEIEYPKDKLDFYFLLKEEIDKVFYNYDVTEEVKLFLDAKSGGFAGIPNAVDLVHNCETIKEDLGKFANKINDLFFKELRKENSKEDFVNE